MCIDLQGKVALVTGASRGIGAAVARDMAEHDAAVVINYLHAKDNAETIKNEIVAAGGRAIAVKADVRDRGAVDKMVAAAEKELGPIDILVNNANIDFPIQPFTEMTWPDIQAKLTGEIGAMVHCCQAVIPGMITKKYGKIVLISSTLSREAGYGFGAHCAAKAAMDSLARTMALELGPAGIHVNVVGPGLTRTDATAGMPPEVFTQTEAQTPLRRVAEPQDIANAVMFLASDMADHITGQYIPVDGGGLML
ncbi:MAG: SDR family oxidoreductase [Deltaproteobacteria bacterium]|jgi:3-oxoacyl-[acyl-carrier protein] reductase|nr:SDR family oxidoreductase [Deltaproteobacteria bacterium]